MEGHLGQVNINLAQNQWESFYQSLSKKANIELIEPKTHVPDMVFTANAGLITKKGFVLSRFKHQERRREESYFENWFKSRVSNLIHMPKNISFEGAGDALWQPGENLLWMAHGFRTDIESHTFLSNKFQIKIISLKLVNPSYYHLDTCFCPLMDKHIMYYPAAFNADSLQLIEDFFPLENRIIVSNKDAENFACNSVLVGRNLFLNFATQELLMDLKSRGYTPIVQPVNEFLKAGGGNKCLTLSLDE